MSTKKVSEPVVVLRQVEKADSSVLFSSLMTAFFQFFSSLLSCLSFLCLFLSFLFSSLFSSLSTLSVLFFSSLSLLPALNPEPAKAALEGAPKTADSKKEGDKKEGDKKDADKKEAAPKEAETKEGDKASNKKEAPKEPEKPKETTVVMKVPICETCVDLVRGPLSKMDGVSSVECDCHREKVTVVATTASPADILIQCVKAFSSARPWRDDD